MILLNLYFNYIHIYTCYLDTGTIETEVAMFGQPISIRLSSVIIGCRLIGQPHFMSTAVDLISALMKVKLIFYSLCFVLLM